MTEQEALDTAARAAGFRNWYHAEPASPIAPPSPKPSIRAHAASLQRIAELEAKLDALKPSEEEREAARVYLCVRNTGDVATILRKYVLQEQPADPLVEAFQDAGIVPPCNSIIDSVAALREALASRGLAIVKERA